MPVTFLGNLGNMGNVADICNVGNVANISKIGKMGNIGHIKFEEVNFRIYFLLDQDLAARAKNWPSEVKKK